MHNSFDALNFRFFSQGGLQSIFKTFSFDHIGLKIDLGKFTGPVPCQSRFVRHPPWFSFRNNHLLLAFASAFRASSQNVFCAWNAEKCYEEDRWRRPIFLSKVMIGGSRAKIIADSSRRTDRFWRHW